MGWEGKRATQPGGTYIYIFIPGLIVMQQTNTLIVKQLSSIEKNI